MNLFCINHGLLLAPLNIEATNQGQTDANEVQTGAEVREGTDEIHQNNKSACQNFRDRYFLTEQGIKFDTADFHNKWIKSINKALLEGGQQMILSPPRHGKTELLIHFVVWLICRNPNIRIMWVIF